MSPAQAIASLDEQLVRHGENVVHHVMVNGAPAPGAGTTCRAFVRGMKPEELVGSITQKDRKVTISPTSIASIAEGSRLMISGKAHRAAVVEPVKLDGVVVRVNILAQG